MCVNTHFFISNAFFNEPQTLLRCCLKYVSIVILKHFLYLVDLYSCLSLGVFMLCLYDLFSIDLFIFIMNVPIITLKDAEEKETIPTKF